MGVVFSFNKNCQHKTYCIGVENNSVHILCAKCKKDLTESMKSWQVGYVMLDSLDGKWNREPINEGLAKKAVMKTLNEIILGNRND